MNKTVDGIIFSYDRAMQLDSVLRSFYNLCKDHELINMTVLYKVSNELHASQYENLQKEYQKVNFILQSDFRSDVLKWVISSSSRQNQTRYQIFTDTFLKTRKNKYLHIIFNRFVRQFVLRLLPYEVDKYLLFLVDDNIFCNDFSISTVIQHLNKCQKTLGFSLRLGQNTSYCYAHNSNQALPSFTTMDDHVLSYDWTVSEHDFKYPLEISSSVYRTKQIIPLLLRFFFDNPNALEGVMAAQWQEYTKKFPKLMCFERSVTFCNPINVVQKVTPNRAGTNTIYTAESLSQLFENGKRIDVNKYDGFIPTGCHQEVELFLI